MMRIKPFVFVLMLLYTGSGIFGQTAPEINHNNPVLNFYTEDPNDTSFFDFDVIDLSRLKYSYNEEQDAFETQLPFTVKAPVAAQKVFWFYQGMGKDAGVSWMIYNEKKQGLCKSFTSIITKKDKFVSLQGQDHLTELISPGKYVLIYFVKKIPKEEEWVTLRVGTTSRAYYNGLKSALMLARN